jgi:F0F1-type ATP synthase assembly protein I
MPSFNDFRRDQNPGERTHAQRLLTYGTLAVIFALVTLLTWTGIWDLSDSSKGSSLKYLMPLASAFFVWRVVTEVRSDRRK